MSASHISSSSVFHLLLRNYANINMATRRIPSFITCSRRATFTLSFCSFVFLFHSTTWNSGSFVFFSLHALCNTFALHMPLDAHLPPPQFFTSMDLLRGLSSSSSGIGCCRSSPQPNIVIQLYTLSIVMFCSCLKVSRNAQYWSLSPFFERLDASSL